MPKSTSSRRRSKKTLTLARLICTQEWELLENTLETNHCAIPTDDAIDRPISKQLLLHFACRFQAPLSSLILIANYFPESVEHADSIGRFPIHVASKWGALPDVCAFLIGSNPSAAGIQDSLGKTPMHYIGEYYTRTYQYNAHAVGTLEDNMKAVVKILKRAAPKSMNLEDDDEINAIEYAIEYDAPLSVIKSMQRTSRDGWRDMRQQCQGKKHSELEKDLERMSSKLQMDLREHHYAGCNASSVQVAARMA